ncbi:uncharacterized protein K460DRAFT_360488 [Cucurbitaria berberidis CBS 394.84]|uniref:Uncharacterized protein n=1 Tax=Cucurbitaria berberidis CBS 394.84 TaxID=1168544 RepID=A0A9P4GNB7_9PLEO|nr:uncharacterized protein K460DRAFT_360488 [Cucurbitaria berberidis CBS 394.84]KAF1849618.1 hypothetical protein K460DRAFT_360488 [Cucurbitaria berberidis CBS 394.84]
MTTSQEQSVRRTIHSKKCWDLLFHPQISFTDLFILSYSEPKFKNEYLNPNRNQFIEMANKAILKSTKQRENICSRLQKFYEDLNDDPVFTAKVIEYNANQFAKLSAENTVSSLMNIDGKIIDELDFKGFFSTEWVHRASREL